MKYMEYANILAKNFAKEKTVVTTVSEISSLFHCSERHTKTILGYLNEENWIQWDIQRGRGKKPMITLLLDWEDIQLHEAIQLAKDEQYQKAFTIVKQLHKNVQTQFHEWFQSNVGIFNTHPINDEDLDILKYPFYETDLSLDPIMIQSRHDAHMVQQIYERLVEFDWNSKQLTPKLAHHWESENGKKWTFYLRKNVMFHHGKSLTSQDVLTTMERIDKKDILWRLIDWMEIINPTVIIFHLKEVNHLFPRYLSNVKTSIIPLDMVDKNLMEYPIGTGPFRLVRNDKDIIQLEVFDNYYGYRPWLDRVEIIKVPEQLEDIESLPLILHAPDDSWNELITQEEGADFIMFNCQKDGPIKDDSLRNWICHHINAEAFCLSREIVAHSFITERTQELKDTPREKDKSRIRGERLNLKIAVQEIRDGVNHEREALILQQQLESLGINSSIEIIPFNQISISDVVERYDIFVGGIGLSEDRLLSVLTAMQSGNIGIYPLLNDELKREVDERISLIKTTKKTTLQWKMYFDIEEYLKQNNTIFYLNHRTHTVYESSGSPYIGIELDSHGRVDYRKVWKKI